MKKTISKAESIRRGGIVTIGLGAIFLIAGLVTIAFRIGISSKTTTSVEANEVWVGEFKDSKNNTKYYPVYTFKVNNKSYSCKTFPSSSIKPDDSLSTVYYDPDDPNNCTTAYDDKYFSFCIAALIAAGAMFIVLGFAYSHIIGAKDKDIKK